MKRQVCKVKIRPSRLSPDEIFQAPFLRGSGGNGRAILHSNLLDARLRRPLLDPYYENESKATAGWCRLRL